MLLRTAARYNETIVAAGRPADTRVLPGQTVEYESDPGRTFDAHHAAPVALRDWIRPHGDLHQTRQTRRGTSFFLFSLFVFFGRPTH